MRTILILMFLTISSDCSAQNAPIPYTQNTNLTCKLLDSIKTQIDNSFKLLSIEGDVYIDTRFNKIAKEKNIFCVLVNGSGCDSTCKNEFLNSINIKITSKPFSATICFNQRQYDCLTGVITGLISSTDRPCQIWKYDKSQKILRKK